MYEQNSDFISIEETLDLSMKVVNHCCLSDRTDTITICN